MDFRLRDLCLFIAVIAVFLSAFFWSGPGYNGGSNQSQFHPPVSGNGGAAVPNANFAGLSGRQAYQISQGAGTLPRIAETVIDPIGVHVGDMQHLEVVATSTSKLVKVTAVTDLDHSQVSIPLVFLRSEADGDRYGADWKVNDTHNATYTTAFYATDAAGHESHVDHVWSDACGLPCNGDYTLNYSCNITSLDGVSSGNFYITGGQTLTLNAPFYINSGYSFIPTNYGAIAFGSGGSLNFGSFSTPDCGIFSMTNYQLISSQRYDLTHWYVTYTVEVDNPGPALTGLTATVSSLAPNVQVVAGQDTVHFSPVPANSLVQSSDSFTLLVDRSVPFDWSQVQWSFH